MQSSLLVDFLTLSDFRVSFCASVYGSSCWAEETPVAALADSVAIPEVGVCGKQL